MGMKGIGTKIRPPRDTIADALFSATQHKVLHLLFSSPDRSYFGSELIALAGAGSGAVQRELARLVDSGLVVQRAVGRQKHYQANPDSPIFAELSGIIRKTSGVPAVIKQALQSVSARIAMAVLFGSMAKGTSKSHSDIDLLIVGDDLRLEELYSALEPAEKALRRKISPTLYSADEFRRRRAAKNPFLTKVLAGKSVTILGSPNAVEATR